MNTLFSSPDFDKTQQGLQAGEITKVRGDFHCQYLSKCAGAEECVVLTQTGKLEKAGIVLIVFIVLVFEQISKHSML